MISFPAIDPIPLPAPVWLMKALLVLTFALHFAAVQMLLGGLIVVQGCGSRDRSTHARSHDVCHQSGRTAAPVRPSALWARTLHQQRSDGLVLDTRGSAADALLLAAVPFLDAAGARQHRVVEFRGSAVAGIGDRQNLRQQHDADASP